jgi:hypothetical protein
MKAAQITKTTAVVLTIAFLSIFSFAQNGKVWLTINNQANVPTIVNGSLISSNASFNQVINDLNIQSVEKALPASRSSKLQNVYEITCNCNVVELYTTLTNQIPVVSKVEYAPIYETLDMPNDYYSSFNTDYALDLINAQGAWDLTHGNPNFVIAVSDQNFYNMHEELVGKITYYDSTNTATRTHGTAVAILAAGNTNNGIGKASIGYNSKLGLYRMNYNEMLTASYSGAKVINLSWTSGCSFSQYAQDAINEAYNNGSFIIASAGNGTTCGGADNLVYPAAYSNVFSVTSVGPTNNHEKIIGNPSTTHQHNTTVDLSAPGYDVAISAASGWYLNGSGTSYAAPQVSGTVGLMLAINPCLSQADIEYILKSSAFNIDSINPLYAGKIGAGRLDAAAAVTMALNWTSIIVEANTTSTCAPNGGTIELTVNGTAPFNAIWDNGQTGLTIDSLTVGSYHVTVTDALGCTTDTTFIVDTILPLEFDAQITNVTCNGLASGAIDITITQGNALSFWWDFNDIATEDLNNLEAGTYRVKITNENGCTTFGSFTVNEPELLSATILTTQPDEIITANLDLVVNGGTPEYQFVWNNYATTEDQNDVEAGYYTVTITDANGCETTAGATIEENISVDTTTNNGGENNTSTLIENDQVEFQIYPNPANEFTNAQWNGKFNTLTIINAQGQVVRQENIENLNNFQIQNLENGTYFIRLKNKNQTLTDKLIIY